MHGLSCSVACGIFLYQGWNICPLDPRWILIHCTTREVLESAFGHEILNDLDTLRSKNSEKEIYIYICMCVCVCVCVCTHTHNLVLGRVLSIHISFLEMPSLIVLWILPSSAVS